MPKDTESSTKLIEGGEMNTQKAEQIAKRLAQEPNKQSTTARNAILIAALLVFSTAGTRPPKTWWKSK
jgi:hypothetical protein